MTYYTAAAFVAIVVAILLAVIVWRDHQANKREAELQLTLASITDQNTLLAAQVKGQQQTRNEDIQAHHLREAEGTAQMERAGKILNQRSSAGEQRWIVSGDDCDMTDKEKADLELT